MFLPPSNTFIMRGISTIHHRSNTCYIHVNPLSLSKLRHHANQWLKAGINKLRISSFMYLPNISHAFIRSINFSVWTIPIFSLIAVNILQPMGNSVSQVMKSFRNSLLWLHNPFVCCLFKTLFPHIPGGHNDTHEHSCLVSCTWRYTCASALLCVTFST